MAEKRENEDHETELRVKLVKRLAVAGVMVAILLGVLAFFEYLAKPEESDAPVFTKPVPVPPKKEITQPVKPNIDLPEPPQSESKPAEVPSAEILPKPEVAAQPVPTPTTGETDNAKPVIKPASARPLSSSKVLEPAVKAPAVVPPVLTKVVPEGSAGPSTPGVLTAMPTTPTAKPVEAIAPATARLMSPVIAPAPNLPRLLVGYVVQAGVFASASAAEELHAKLALNGIPSSLEARVSIGPFKTREEAAVAQVKLKALGIDSLLIPPAGRK